MLNSCLHPSPLPPCHAVKLNAAPPGRVLTSRSGNSSRSAPCCWPSTPVNPVGKPARSTIHSRSRETPSPPRRPARAAPSGRELAGVSLRFSRGGGGGGDASTQSRSAAEESKCAQRFCCAQPHGSTRWTEGEKDTFSTSTVWISKRCYFNPMTFPSTSLPGILHKILPPKRREKKRKATSDSTRCALIVFSRTVFPCCSAGLGGISLPLPCRRSSFTHLQVPEK